MKYTEKMLDRIKCKFQEFDSINELTSYLASSKDNRHFSDRGVSQSHSTSFDSYEFSGTRDYQEAMDLLEHGWEASAKRISKKIPIQTTNQPAKRSVQTYGVVGGQASVPRYLQGIPTNMVDRKNVPMKQKIIVINRDMSFASRVSKEQIEEEGIRALQIIQALENRGYRVRLNLYWITRVDEEAVAFRVTVKKPEERFSLLKVAFPLAHPSMLRRIGFKWIEVHPTMVNSGFTYGYGRPSGNLIKRLIPDTEYQLPAFIHSVEEFLDYAGLK